MLEALRTWGDEGQSVEQVSAKGVTMRKGDLLMLGTPHRPGSEAYESLKQATMELARIADRMGTPILIWLTDNDVSKRLVMAEQFRKWADDNEEELNKAVQLVNKDNGVIDSADGARAMELVSQELQKNSLEIARSFNMERIKAVTKVAQSLNNLINETADDDDDDDDEDEGEDES